MRIHLAGCENNFSLLALRAGCRNLLFSYYHIQKTGDAGRSRLFNIWNQNSVESVICDSGLFTMMFGAGKGKTYSFPELDQYAEAYIKQAKNYALNNLTIVECDVHKILGMKEVFELRKRFEDSGMRVLYVWHKEEGLEGLYRMAEKYRSIAISVPELRTLFVGSKIRYQDAVFDLLSKIKKNVPILPRIHLLGNTIRETMQTSIAWSCDSTSWLSSTRYGNASIFVNNEFKPCHVNSEIWRRVCNENYSEDAAFIKTNISPTASIDYLLSNLCYARQFMKYQNWLDAHYQWIGDDLLLEGRMS